MQSPRATRLSRSTYYVQPARKRGVKRKSLFDVPRSDSRDAARMGQTMSGLLQRRQNKEKLQSVSEAENLRDRTRMEICVRDVLQREPDENVCTMQGVQDQIIRMAVDV